MELMVHISSKRLIFLSISPTKRYYMLRLVVLGLCQGSHTSEGRRHHVVHCSFVDVAFAQASNIFLARTCQDLFQQARCTQHRRFHHIPMPHFHVSWLIGNVTPQTCGRNRILEPAGCAQASTASFAVVFARHIDSSDGGLGQGEVTPCIR